MKIRHLLTLVAGVHALASGHVFAGMTPDGFSSIYNGKDFSGWRAENPHDYVKLRDAKKIAAKREQDRRGVSHALADQRRGDSQ